MTDAEKQIRKQIAPIARLVWVIARQESLSPAARYADITEEIVDLMLAQRTAVLEEVSGLSDAIDRAVRDCTNLGTDGDKFPEGATIRQVVYEVTNKFRTLATESEGGNGKWDGLRIKFLDGFSNDAFTLIEW